MKRCQGEKQATTMMYTFNNFDESMLEGYEKSPEMWNKDYSARDVLNQDEVDQLTAIQADLEGDQSWNVGGDQYAGGLVDYDALTKYLQEQGANKTEAENYAAKMAEPAPVQEEEYNESYIERLRGG